MDYVFVNLILLTGLESIRVSNVLPLRPIQLKVSDAPYIKGQDIWAEKERSSFGAQMSMPLIRGGMVNQDFLVEVPSKFLKIYWGI